MNEVNFIPYLTTDLISKKKMVEMDFWFGVDKEGFIVQSTKELTICEAKHKSGVWTAYVHQKKGEKSVLMLTAETSSKFKLRHWRLGHQV